MNRYLQDFMYSVVTEEQEAVVTLCVRRGGGEHVGGVGGGQLTFILSNKCYLTHLFNT